MLKSGPLHVQIAKSVDPPVGESEICFHLAHLLQPDSRHGWGPKFQNLHLKTLREYGGYSMGLVSLNSQNVHGMNEMNKNEHFCSSI